MVFNFIKMSISAIEKKHDFLKDFLKEALKVCKRGYIDAILSKPLWTLNSAEYALWTWLPNSHDLNYRVSFLGYLSRGGWKGRPLWLDPPPPVWFCPFLANPLPPGRRSPFLMVPIHGDWRSYFFCMEELYGYIHRSLLTQTAINGCKANKRLEKWCFKCN